MRVAWPDGSRGFWLCGSRDDGCCRPSSSLLAQPARTNPSPTASVKAADVRAMVFTTGSRPTRLRHLAEILLPRRYPHREANARAKDGRALVRQDVPVLQRQSFRRRSRRTETAAWGSSGCPDPSRNQQASSRAAAQSRRSGCGSFSECPGRDRVSTWAESGEALVEAFRGASRPAAR